MRTPALLRSVSAAPLATALCLGLLLGAFAGSCQPGSRGVDETPVDPPPPDLLIPPPPPCDAGRVRCTANRDATEVCDGKDWQRKDTCDLANGGQCVEGVCKSACDLAPRGNVGCSFYPVNLWSTSSDGQLGIVVTNTSDRLTAEVTLEDASGVIGKTETIPPATGTTDGVVIFKLPHGRNKLDRTEQALKGFHLKSTAPVAAYLFHPIDAATVHSGSATLLLPEHVMARNYFVMSYTYNAELITLPPQGEGLLAVVGLSDSTTVEITVPVATQPGGGVPSAKAGGTIKRVINRLEVLEIAQALSREDISGATVKASAPVAVYGGAGGVSIPASALGGNHLGVQMFPLETWGKSYFGAKAKQRNASDKDRYRIVASVDNTSVKLTSSGGTLPAVPVLARGQIYEFATAADVFIEADQPILVFQYMPAWGDLSGAYDPKDFPDGVSGACSFRFTPDTVKCIGDANVTPLVPVEQFRSDYIFYVPQTYSYDYVSVTAPIDAVVTLDGAPVTEPLRPIAGGYGRAIVRMTKTGNHRITATKPFGLIGYGYAYATSYSYAGGLNLDRINPIE